MRKITAVVLALGLVGVIVVGCGTPSEKQVASKLESHAQRLDDTNYKSTATMTVQMENSSQSYYVETWYDSQDQYRIALGDANKNIHQYIVHNKNGMFIVSPSLGKVFRFNGNWAQNQGHIYLYDQILQQIASGKNVHMSKSNGVYSFDLPVQPGNDVIVKQKVEVDVKTLNPQSVTLFDKDSHAVVTLKYNQFQTNVQFKTDDFNPQAILESGKTAKPTMASDTSDSFHYIEPDEIFGDALTNITQQDSDTILKYAGNHGFTLQEWRPNPGVSGMSDNAVLVDLFGVPALYTGTDSGHQLTWLNNDIQFALTSNNLSLDQMKQIAISTFGRIGK